jgi:23S rRNA (uracil1939-C5)-methyltransferase
MRSGDVLDFEIDKAAAGGRMLARHQGRVVLVSGAIPGERVVARVERVSSAVVFAETLEVERASPDRRSGDVDVRCGGCAFAHIAYERQLRLKQEIVQDAFGRIARIPMSALPPIVQSPESGYRMRARLHARGSRLGFFREGTHEICDAGATRQLAAGAVGWIGQISELMRVHRLEGLGGLELAETIAGTARVCHLDLQPGADPDRFRVLAEHVEGLSAQIGDRAGAVVLGGRPWLTDVLGVGDGVPTPELTLQRNVRAFFQSNRFLVAALARHVATLVPDGPAIDLYAGVGLFGLSLAARGVRAVTLVEGDPVSGADLLANAGPYADVRLERTSVEAFAAGSSFAPLAAGATVIVDPPRTGLSKPVLEAIVGAAPPRVVYVSCDPATLARDSRRLVDGGYEMVHATLFDMFPNTAHIESVVSFVRN